MSEALTLFWIFLQIGLFTFGGGYAMIPMMREELVGGGFITEELLRDFIGISESTPGPFAVNMATFIGMEHGGLLGAFFATLGVVLPSFVILLLIARFGSKLIESKGMNHAFLGLKPTVVGLVLGVAATLIVGAAFSGFDLRGFFTGDGGPIVFDWKATSIMLLVFSLMRWRKEATPIRMILLSALLGIALYGIF